MTKRSDSFSGFYAQFSDQVRSNTPEQRRRAALAVCAVAHDRDDAKNLLDLLGLLEEPKP